MAAGVRRSATAVDFAVETLRRFAHESSHIGDPLHEKRVGAKATLLDRRFRGLSDTIRAFAQEVEKAGF